MTTVLQTNQRLQIPPVRRPENVPTPGILKRSERSPLWATTPLSLLPVHT